MLHTLTADVFAPHLHTTFQLIFGPNIVLPMELIDVTVHDRPRKSMPWEQSNQAQRLPFAIIFRGPGDEALEQKMYTMTHDQLGTIGDLFLVPVGMDQNGRYYEAVFT